MMLSFEVKLALGLALITFIFVNIVFNVRFFAGAREFALDILGGLLDGANRRNAQRYIARRKREAIHKGKENLISRYNTVVEAAIMDFGWPLTLESFTSALCVTFVFLVFALLLFMKSLTLSVALAVSVFIVIITALIMQSKSLKAERLESIMDAEDIICPLAHEGVFVAIKKALESEDYISESIRQHFAEFVNNCENNGYSFRQAMEILNRRLGPKFDNFAKKAVVFEYNERKGMADIFLDVVDDNAILREINRKKDKVFSKMNRDFMIKTLIIVLFFLYALTVPEFKSFMIGSTAGKVINTVLLSTVCLSFARCQALQGDLDKGVPDK
ncbi:MAG: hypothetical protein FWG06_01400 [Clostridiales bacterium]|nr:hypothetical protein [Clostridiales bacterium]